MNLRKEIEKLIYWYVPIYILGHIIASIFAVYYKAIPPNSEATLVAIGLAMSYFTKYLPNFVTAIWLYNIAKQNGHKYILWTLFGLVAHIFAVALFIALYVYEKVYSTEDEEIKEKRKLFIWSK